MALAGCRAEYEVPPQPADPFETLPLGKHDAWEAYRYRAYDRSGDLAAEGTLRLPTPLREGERFEGTWKLAVAGDRARLDPFQEAYVGPQSGEGELAGYRTGGTVFVNLQPGLIDHNVELSGRFAGGRLVGDWQYVSDAGPTSGGAFEAVPE